MQILIGLGGNQGDTARAFAGAASALRDRFGKAAVSGMWRCRALGPPQPDYLNAALLVTADVHPLQVLACCAMLEAGAGRDRSREVRWGPRPLDLDLLVAPGVVVESPALRLPHPRLSERRFALLPAIELASSWIHPRLHRTLASLAAEIEPASQPCERIGGFPYD